MPNYLCSLPGVGPKTAYCVMMYSLKRSVFPADANVIRVAYRMGLTGFSPLQHKKAQEELVKKIPPKLSYTLHVNMVQHGRKVCTKLPKCNSCSIRKFCKSFRGNARKGRKGHYSVVDLFCGAGGLSTGFSRRGFKLLFAIDNSSEAIDTFRLNHPELSEDNIFLGDIGGLIGKRLNSVVLNNRVDVVVGGPPCQGFSLAGARIRSSINGVRYLDDARNHLYKEFARIVKKLAPKIFIMENVIGFLSAKDGFYRQAIYHEFNKERPRYLIQELRIDASEFGVPQARHRLWFVGVKIDRKGSKKSSQVLDAITKQLEREKEDPPTLLKTIQDLPFIGPGGGGEVIHQVLHKGNEKLVFNHLARKHHPRDLKLFKLLQPGERGYEAVYKYGRPDLMPFRTDIFKDKYRKLRGDMISPTIVAHLEKDAHMFIHPEIPRGLTVRESARLQTFPDDYIFLGSFGQQFRQVGNAVPPLLSLKLASAIGVGLSTLAKN